MPNRLTERDVVIAFSTTLGLQNQTDGSLFIYRNNSGVPMATKPDGYYYYEGITFILDAKAPGERFTGQLEDYMKLESNTNFIGFKYDGNIFECYVKGKKVSSELKPKSKEYYREKYFPIKKNNQAIVEDSAKKLADLFRRAKIDKQINVPFIGAALLCLRYQDRAEIDLTSTSTIISSIKRGVNAIIQETPLTKKQKKEFIKTTLDDQTLTSASDGDMFLIMTEISKVFNFINISSSDYEGHDIMNNFLKVFRTWNSVNANEKGEVFTPDHIAQLMYKIAKCNKDTIILDPTCGSGTFLTNAMANMFKETNDPEEQKYIKENRLIGIESIAFNATLAGINMMLHGDGSSTIFKDDCFRKVPDLRNCYNRVLMNPPFSQLEDPELKFVYVALENMCDDGYLATIVPKSCVKGRKDLEKTNQNIEWLTRILSIADLEAVVSLPRDLFTPNAGTSTCILLLHKTNQPHNCETLLVNCLNDGFVRPKSGQRYDKYEKWPEIERKILGAFCGNYDEFLAVSKRITVDDELLFEHFSSNRGYEVSKITFQRYLREYAASKVLCNDNTIESVDRNIVLPENIQMKKFPINHLINLVGKGQDKSVDRKVEDKYNLDGIPLIIAKKDTNGVGGMICNPTQIYRDKICIIAGGDGAGGKTYYVGYDFAATNFVLICDFINDSINMDKYAKFYLSVVISERLFSIVGNGRTINQVPIIQIELPVNEDGLIDINYMSNFIKLLPFSEYL